MKTTEVIPCHIAGDKVIPNEFGIEMQQVVPCCRTESWAGFSRVLELPDGRRAPVRMYQRPWEWVAGRLEWTIRIEKDCYPEPHGSEGSLGWAYGYMWTGDATTRVEFAQREDEQILPIGWEERDGFAIPSRD